MTIREIIYNAAIYGQIDEVILAIENNELLSNQDGTLSSSSGNKDAADTANRLVRCANLVLGEIASEYLPLVKTEIVTSVDGLITFESLTENLIDVVKLTKNGNKQGYKLKHDGIVVPNGRYQLEYNYYPKKYKYEESIGYKSAVITTRVIAYGVITEYCIISGLTDDAVMWDRRFRDSLAAIKTRSERKVKLRSFA